MTATLIIPIILAVVFVILMLLLRALVAPVMLIATVVLSFAAALGVSALFFNHVFNFGGADTSFPLFVFVFLVALGIDYNIFLMTRVREEAQRHGPRTGALTGLAATGGVITSAGCVLAGTFAVLGTLPVTFLTELGLRGGVRRAARHDRGPLGARDGAEPGPGPVGLVAEPAGPPAGAGGGNPDRRAGRRPVAAGRALWDAGAAGAPASPASAGDVDDDHGDVVVPARFVGRGHQRRGRLLRVAGEQQRQDLLVRAARRSGRRSTPGSDRRRGAAAASDPAAPRSRCPGRG